MLDVKTATPQEISVALVRAENLRVHLSRVTSLLEQLRNPNVKLTISTDSKAIVCVSQSPKDETDEMIEKIFRPYLIAKWEERELEVRAEIEEILGGTTE